MSELARRVGPRPWWQLTTSSRWGFAIGAAGTVAGLVGVLTFSTPPAWWQVVVAVFWLVVGPGFLVSATAQAVRDRRAARRRPTAPPPARPAFVPVPVRPAGARGSRGDVEPRTVAHRRRVDEDRDRGPAADAPAAPLVPATGGRHGRDRAPAGATDAGRPVAGAPGAFADDDGADVTRPTRRGSGVPDEPRTTGVARNGAGAPGAGTNGVAAHGTAVNGMSANGVAADGTAVNGRGHAATAGPPTDPATSRLPGLSRPSLGTPSPPDVPSGPIGQHPGSGPAEEPRGARHGRPAPGLDDPLSPPPGRPAGPDRDATLARADGDPAERRGASTLSFGGARHGADRTPDTGASGPGTGGGRRRAPEPASGPATPGPATPGPATPGPATPGPATPGVPTPRDAPSGGTPASPGAARHGRPTVDGDRRPHGAPRGSGRHGADASGRGRHGAPATDEQPRPRHRTPGP